MTEKHQETAEFIIDQHITDTFAESKEPMSPVMKEVQNYAWTKGRYWYPTRVIYDAHKFVQNALERMGIKHG